MTYPEAAIQAGRELGVPMGGVVPGQGTKSPLVPDEIPPGQERAIIDEMKTMLEQFWKKRNESN
jgi:hypothetical protein